MEALDNLENADVKMKDSEDAEQESSDSLVEDSDLEIMDSPGPGAGSVGRLNWNVDLLDTDWLRPLTATRTETASTTTDGWTTSETVTFNFLCFILVYYYIIKIFTMILLLYDIVFF